MTALPARRRDGAPGLRCLSDGGLERRERAGARPRQYMDRPRPESEAEPEGVHRPQPGRGVRILEQAGPVRERASLIELPLGLYRRDRQPAEAQDQPQGQRMPARPNAHVRLPFHRKQPRPGSASGAARSAHGETRLACGRRRRLRDWDRREQTGSARPLAQLLPADG